MADAAQRDKNGLPFFEPEEWDYRNLPDYDTAFTSQEDLDAFAEALAAPTTSPVVALNDWRPIHQKVKKNRPRRKPSKRTKDETREGFVYSILHYPLLIGVMGWIVFLFIAYNITRAYVVAYEKIFTWKGKRQKLRNQLQKANSYEEWTRAAQKLDEYLGNEEWKESDPYSYYNHQTVRRAAQELAYLRNRVQDESTGPKQSSDNHAIEDMKALLQSCIKNNFVGVENPRLYSETYIGTKHLVQDFIDEVEKCLETVLDSDQIDEKEKSSFFRHLELNYGRTALCLSGGGTFAYYHFGVVKALRDAHAIPEIITGTSGGALVAALIGTRTDEELKKLLVPALAYRMKVSQDRFTTWALRWYRTGARFDSIEWARECSWYTKGSLTFREAFELTGRVLNVSCVPSDPHSPTILNNHITSPDCVIWSAVLASAAVPGILNPIVLMRKNKDGSLAPYSFGNKWRDGSLRTDIPLKALNIHFNVNFSVVSQVNPHINLFFFSPRGSPGRPVTHRKGRGWRGGFLGSSLETSIKLDLQKYLKILRHLELLPRPMGQDWSEIWLQRFSGNVTIWPKSILSDYWNILSDPKPDRLARMIRVGERSCWPRIKFISNRTKIEKIIIEGVRRSSSGQNGGELPNHVQEQQKKEGELRNGSAGGYSSASGSEIDPPELSLIRRRQSSIIEELSRQASVLWQEDGPYVEEATTDEE